MPNYHELTNATKRGKSKMPKSMYKNKGKNKSMSKTKKMSKTKTVRKPRERLLNRVGRKR